MREAGAPAGEALAAWLLTLPAALAYLLMLLLPTLAVVAFAFTDRELGAASFRWIGLSNFADLMADRVFARAVGNTIAYVGLTTPAAVAGGLALALLIERARRGRAFFRAVFFLPVVSLTIAMASAWQYLLHPTIGPLNATLRSLGVAGPNWLSGSSTVLLSLAAIGVWQSVGFNMVLFMAGLTAVPRTLYAAAEVDGARSALDRFRLVTWPMLGPTTLFVLTVTMVQSLTRSFDLVVALTQGGPNNASTVLLYALYQEGFTYLHQGYAAAVTVVFLALVLTLMLVQTRLLERGVHYG